MVKFRHTSPFLRRSLQSSDLINLFAGYLVKNGLKLKAISILYKFSCYLRIYKNLKYMKHWNFRKKKYFKRLFVLRKNNYSLFLIICKHEWQKNLLWNLVLNKSEQIKNYRYSKMRYERIFPLFWLQEALRFLVPTIITEQRWISGKKYNLPTEPRLLKNLKLAVRWLALSCKRRKMSGGFPRILCYEVILLLKIKILKKKKLSEIFKDDLPIKNHFERAFFNMLKKKKDSFSPKELRFLQKKKKNYWDENANYLSSYKKEIESFNDFFFKYEKKKSLNFVKKNKKSKASLLRKTFDESIIKDSKSWNFKVSFYDLVRENLNMQSPLSKSKKKQILSLKKKNRKIRGLSYIF